MSARPVVAQLLPYAGKALQSFVAVRTANHNRVGSADGRTTFEQRQAALLRGRVGQNEDAVGRKLRYKTI